MKQISLFFVLPLFIIGCETPIDQQYIYDYSIEQFRGCFCTNGGIWINLYIKGDTVAAAYKISNDQELNYEEFKYYKSIKGLFDLITNTDTTKYELRYTIDSVKNYPTFIYLNPKPIIIGNDTLIIADAQLSYTTRNYINYE
jgi:hypothetical protein